MKFIRQPRHEIGRIAPALSPLGISLRLLTLAALAFVATCGDRFGMAAEDAPVAATTLPAPAAKEMPVTLPPQASAFQAEDISIGEPISLSSAPPMTAPAEAGQTPTAAIRGPSPVPSPIPSPVRGFSAPASALPASGDLQPAFTEAASAPPAAAASGWLGIAVDDALVTGRLVVVEVAPDGPAAKAGVRPQDVLLALNGTQLTSSDELAAALAAIAPGQRVKMAVGRESRVEEVAMLASTRPPEAVTRDWQSASSQNPTPHSAVYPSTPTPPTPAPAQPSLLAAAPNRLLPAARGPSAANGTAEMLPGPVPLETSIPGTSGRTALGVRTVPVNADVQSRYRLSDSQGAFVVGVVQDLPAAKAGVPPGSVIVALNQQPVRSPQELSHLVTRGPVGTPVTLHYVLPGGQAKQAEVVLQSLEQPLERALVGNEGGVPMASPPTLQPAPLMTRRLLPRRIADRPSALPSLPQTPSDGSYAVVANAVASPYAAVQPSAELQPPEPQPLVRLEELLRRLTNQMERLEYRLDRLEAGR